MYLAILRYKVPREEVEPYIPEHISFLEEGYAKGNLIVSGCMLTNKGEMVLSPLTRRGDFDDFLSHDPFMKSGLVDYEIIAFNPSHFHPDFAPFIRESEKLEIELVPYTSEWESRFKEEAEILSQVLGETLVTIHHIGSTAIPGIVAKPIIDILPVVKDIQQVDRLTESLQVLGYEGKGEFGMPGRRFFVKTVAGKRHVNVHIFEKGHRDILRHLLFRDYLKIHPEDAFAYSELKKGLVLESQNDIERYCWGKEDFVKAIEIRASLWNAFLNKVES